MVKQKVKLSKTQQEIIKLLKEGWHIGHSSNYDPICWLQKGKLGYGGETKSVRFPTLWSLVRKGVLKKISKDTYGTQEYVLTKQGRQFIKANKTK